MDIDGLQQQARAIWGGKQMTIDEMAVALGVVYGDICRQARAVQEGKTADAGELQKELGNVIFSAIRWCAELGYDPKACIELARVAQDAYAKKLA